MEIEYATAVDGARIACAAVGDGPSVLVIPAFWTGIDAGIETLGELLQGFRLVAFDRRGQGSSSRGVEVAGELLETDALAVADHFGLTTFRLWSQGAGCFDAVRVAAAHPGRVERLVLFAPIPSGRAWRSNPGVAGWTAALEADWEFGLQAFAQFIVGWGNPGAPAWAERHRNFTDAATIRAQLTIYSEAEMATHAPGVSCPTLVIRQPVWDQPGDWAREVAQLIPGARLLLDTGGEPGRLTDATVAGVREFLRGADAPHGGSAVSRFRTILFTDIVASTPLLAQLKDAKMREVMRDHDEVLTAAVTEHGGRVVKTIGDAFMAEFAVPSAAVEAAIEAQRAVRERFADADVPVRLRIGINAGEPIEEAGDLHGASVVIAKRLESAAGTNGILVSDVVKQMVAGKEFDFEDRGLLALKGFDEPVRAWAVRWEDR